MKIRKKLMRMKKTDLVDFLSFAFSHFEDEEFDGMLEMFQDMNRCEIQVEHVYKNRIDFR